MFRPLRRMLTYHWLLTLALMGLFALLFGLFSLNLIMVLHANLELISRHGTMALLDGALRQLLELTVYGYLAVMAYVLFKACERVLVERILG